MKLLIIKLSSIGDIIHTFPAIIEAKKHIKDLRIDWIIDQNFVDIAKLLNNNNNLINEILPVSLRTLKKHKNFTNIKNLLLELVKLKSKQYDLIIDAQGLLKSALLTKYIRSIRSAGLDWSSAREPSASFLYTNTYKIEENLHAIDRIRKLFSLSLNYKINYIKDPKIYNSLNKQLFSKPSELSIKKIDKYIVFLHGTTWETKEWPIEYWDKLSKLINTKNINVAIIFANNNLKEQKFAEYLINNNDNVIALSKLNMEQIAGLIANSLVVIAVDTGFAHLSSALNVPIIGIYGATCSNRSGVLGEYSINLQSKYHCSPCFAKTCLEYKYKRSTIKQPCLREITPEIIFEKIEKLLTSLK